MAKRRMFSLDIVDSDAFLSLPLSAQALYFHLGMRADDDGFVGKPLAIMKSIGSNNGDMESLIAKRFVLYFSEEGIIIVKHWWMHNLRRKDRYTPTTYREIAEKLYLDSNNSYTTNPEKEKFLETINTPWQPNGNQTATQDKISKDKLSKVNTSKCKLKEIELDKTKYKHFEKCEELVEKLIASTYISEKELDLEDYFAYLDNLLDEYSAIDVKVKVDYFIKQVSVVIPTNDNKFTYRLIEGIEGIKCKFLYFKTAIDKAFKEINKNNLGAIYEL